jgi:hypothetical protein
MKKYCRAVLLVLALQMAWIGSLGALPDTSQPATISLPRNSVALLVPFWQP